MNRQAAFWLKAASAAALLAALGATAALVGARIFFPEPKVRAWVVDSARRQLGRDVRLEGIGVGLRGLSLRGLEVSERPDFSAGSFLRVESFRLRPSWRALLRRRLVVASISAEGLFVRVIKETDGHFNYETLTSGPPTSSASASDSMPAIELNIRRMKVVRGAAEYADKTAGETWALTDLGLSAENIGLADPFTMEGTARVRGKLQGRGVDARISIAANVNPARGSREGFWAEVKSLTVEQDGVKLSASGRVARLDVPEISFDANFSAMGKTLIQAAGSAKLAQAVQVDVKAKTPGLDTTLLAKFVPGLGLPALVLPAVQADFSGTWSGADIEARSLRVAWVNGKLEGAGRARGLGTPHPTFDGRIIAGLDVPPIKPGQYPFLKLPPKLSIPEGRLDVEAAFSGDELKLTALKAKIKEGTVSASGVVRRIGSARPAADVSAMVALDLPAFKAADLPIEVAGFPPNLLVPAARWDGAVRVRGDDIHFEKFIVKAKEGNVRIDGGVAKALAGTPQPDLSVAAAFSLPELTDKELPFSGVPARLRAPRSHWDAEFSLSPRVLHLRKLRLQSGRNDVAVEGSVTDPFGRGAFDLSVKCRSFALEELAQITPALRDLQLTGSGSFTLSVTGHKEKPLFAGKLQFKDVGATVGGLPLADFAGSASFDGQRVDMPNLSGRIADGRLQMNFALKDYGRAPDMQIEASLDRFDLGRYLAAKSRIVAAREAAKASRPESAQAPAKARTMRTRGRLQIGSLLHPNASVEQVNASWDLTGVSAELRGLNGGAKLHVGGGSLHALGDMATQSKLLKVLIFPLLVVQKIGRIGGIRLFPDFNDMTLRQIKGDYAFQNGVMTLRESEMDSDAAQVSARGRIDLPAETLDLVVTAQVANVAPMDVSVTGTFDQPKTRVELGKFLAEPAKQLIEGLLKR